MELRFYFCFALVEQVVEGEDAALKVGGWISSACVDRLHVEVFIFLTFFHLEMEPIASSTSNAMQHLNSVM